VRYNNCRELSVFGIFGLSFGYIWRFGGNGSLVELNLMT